MNNIETQSILSRGLVLSYVMLKVVVGPPFHPKSQSRAESETIRADCVAAVVLGQFEPFGRRLIDLVSL